MIKILGFLDLLTALSLTATHYGWLNSNKVLFVFILYLLIKGWAFKGDIASAIDLVIALYMITLMFGFHSFLTVIAIIYLLQKAIFSLIA